jgi:hypothetical protein
MFNFLTVFDLKCGESLHINPTHDNDIKKMQKRKLGNSNLEGPAIGLGRQISAGVSLCILALGFLLIGLVLLIHPSLSPVIGSPLVQ